MQKRIVGWDVGGAHIKAALLDIDGKISQTFQLPCPLWKGLDYLVQAVEQINRQIDQLHCVHVITMTGELVDLFDNRDDGVKQIINSMRASLDGNEILIYAGLNGVIAIDEVTTDDYAAIASANWLASSVFAAGKLENALFIDIGSTTTDLLVLSAQKVKAIGLTDYARLRSGELVYTGVVRTAVMAVAQSACFKGQNMSLMAEYFATMADVYRLTGELNEAHDQADTADGAEKSVFASARRLSRMTGYDYLQSDLSLWVQFAEQIKSQQKNKIKQACERQLSRNLLSHQHYFIGAGVGRFLVRQLADDLGYPYIDFSELLDQQSAGMGIDISDCAPAVAVALLAAAI